MCLTESEQKERDWLVKEARKSMTFLFKHGCGNPAPRPATSSPNTRRSSTTASAEYEYLEDLYTKLSEEVSQKGAQLRAMMTCCTMPKELAEKFSVYCKQCADKVDDPVRKEELLKMAENTAKVPWNGATNFWEAVQSLWMTHMLVMSDENYPGPGVSFGRIDQYLYPYYKKSIEEND